MSAGVVSYTALSWYALSLLHVIVPEVAEQLGEAGTSIKFGNTIMA